MKKQILSVIVSAALLTNMQSHAQASDAASAVSALSALPTASVVVVSYGASIAASAVVTVPVALSATGAVLVVKSVEASAKGAVYVLERASDGARVTLELSSRAGRRISIGVGDSMTVSVVAAGAMISFAGEVIAFVPNELGRALLHNERVTF
jgi:hypothetical protein